MYKKAVGILIANLVFCCGLIAELHWWAPKEVPILKGYVDSHGIAVNQYGKAIAIFNEKILGSYDVVTGLWSLFKLNMTPDGVQVVKINGEENIVGFSSEIPSKGTRIVLNDYDQGFAIFRISEGPNIGKIGCLSYLNGSWGQFTVLSDEEGRMPVIAQSCSGGAVAVWVNKEKGSDDEGFLMGAYYNGYIWEKQGVISTCKSVKASYSQSSLQLGIDDMDDAVVIWRACNQEDRKGGEDNIVVAYFDGMQGKWMSEEVLAEQSQGKTGLHLSINNKGDVAATWESEEGVEGAFLNLSQYMLKNYYGIKNLSGADWTKGTIAQGEELSTPKVAVDQRGNVVAMWLEGYSGVNSAYFNGANKSWERIESPLSSKAAYANAIQAGANGIYSVWIGEGDALQEIISTSSFDISSKKWSNCQILNLKNEGSSLIDTVESFSLAEANYGMVLWYDFFKEQLFYAVLKEGKDLSLEGNAIQKEIQRDRKQGRLYQKKAEFAKRRAERNKNKAAN